jgi:hypothetical protein
MKTKTYNVYTFDELTDKQKEKAVENLSYINTDHDWWEFTYQDAENVGLRLKYFGLDHNRHATGEFMVLGGGEQCAGLIMAEHGKDTPTHKTAAAYLAELKKVDEKYPDRENDDDQNDEYTDAAGLLQDDFLHDLLEDYSIVLQNEYEYLTSEEAIIETIRANEYDFTEDGKLD